MKTAWIVVAAAWMAVALVAAGLHPALRDGAPLAGLGRQIAEDAAQGGAFLEELGLSGSNVTLAFWALDLSLLYIAGWVFFALCPRGSGAPAPLPRALPVTALAGQVAATALAGNEVGFYFLAAGIPVLSLVPSYLEPGPPVEPRPRWGRLVTVSMVGMVFVLLASPVDWALAQLTGAAILPEAWFPIAVEWSSGRSLPMTIALSLVVAAACGALGFARAGWVGLAPACVLVLGPSNPAKGLAAAAVVALLARVGAGPWWRTGFLIVLTAVFVVPALL